MKIPELSSSLFVVFLSIFMSLAMTPTLASAHGGGGGGGDDGGSSDSGDASGKAERESSNPEEKTRPSGFGEIKTGKNIYPKREPFFKAQKLKLVKANQITRENLTDHGNSNWDSRANKNAKKSWEDNSMTAYGVMRQSSSKVVQSNPAFVGTPHPAAAALPDAVANAAWSMATLASKSKGDNAMVGFSANGGNAGSILSSKQTVRMKNLAP